MHAPPPSPPHPFAYNFVARHGNSSSRVQHGATEIFLWLRAPNIHHRSALEIQSKQEPWHQKSRCQRHSINRSPGCPGFMPSSSSPKPVAGRRVCLAHIEATKLQHDPDASMPSIWVPATYYPKSMFRLVRVTIYRYFPREVEQQNGSMCTCLKTKLGCRVY